MKLDSKASQQETKFETDFIKLDFEINNGDYVIYEYCSELVRQVQQAKEEEIERLENLAESLIKEIGDYKKEITEKYLNNKEFKSKFTQRLNVLQSEAAKCSNASSSSNSLEEFEFKIKAEKNLLHKSIFDGKFMKFDKTEPKAIYKKQSIGNLEIEDKNLIDADFNLVKMAQLTIPDEVKQNLSKCVHHRYFGTGECFLAFETKNEYTFDFYVLNKDKTVKVTKSNMKAFNRDFLKLFHVVRNKLAYHQTDGSIVVYDNNLKLLHKYENIFRLNSLSDSELEEDSDGSMSLSELKDACNRLETKNVLIGASETGLFFANEDDDNLIEVCDWSFKYLDDIRFYIDIDPTCEFYLFRLYNDKYYFIDGSFNLNIIKKPDTLIKKIENVTRYEIDSNENLILFHCFFCDEEEERKKRLIGFYDLNGEHKYDLKLVNFSKDLKQNDFQYVDDYENAYDNWKDAISIEKSGNRLLLFFDRETFTFQEIVPDEFVSSEIAIV